MKNEGNSRNMNSAYSGKNDNKWQHGTFSLYSLELKMTCVNDMEKQPIFHFSICQKKVDLGFFVFLYLNWKLAHRVYS